MLIVTHVQLELFHLPALTHALTVEQEGYSSTGSSSSCTLCAGGTIVNANNTACVSCASN